MQPGDATEWTRGEVASDDRLTTWRWSIVLLIGLLALVMRLLVVLSSGGLYGFMGNDPGVYFTGAAALTFGRVPYVDFYFVHPPAILLLLTPFAWLARLTTDPIGFATANVFSMLIGAVNAIVVARIGWRATGDFRAALAGGAFYAVWFGAVTAEFSARLEPYGTLFFLLGFALLQLGRPGDGPSRNVCAGILFGLAVLVKIWWVVPVTVVLGWRILGERSRRGVLPAVAGGFGTAIVILGPFLSAAGSSLWTMVVGAQVGRGHSATQGLDRLVALGAEPVPGAMWPGLAATAAYAGLIWFAVLCWRSADLRPIVIILAAQLLILVTGPSWFNYYTGYVAGPLGLVVAGGAAAWRRGRRQGPRSRWMILLAPALVAAALTAVDITRTDYVEAIEDRAQIATALRTEKCVTSDYPTALIQVDVMTRGLAAGCPNWVDVTAPRMVHPDLGKPGSGPKWLDTLTHYLASGDAIVLTGRPLGFRPTDIAELAAGRQQNNYGRWLVFLR